MAYGYGFYRPIREDASALMRLSLSNIQHEIYLELYLPFY